MAETYNLDLILQKQFHMPSFRKGQKEIIESVLAGKDCLAVLPTGGGKSLCYQLPAAAKSGLVIVISPLIALMKDQVLGLVEKGLRAGCLYSGQTMDEKRKIFQDMEKPGHYLLLLSPERVQKDGFAKWLQNRKVALFAIDEAHCVSQWGHDFRPEYSELSLLKKLRPDVPVLALTASATPLVLGDIARVLQLKRPQKHVHGFYRPNLYYQVEICQNDDEKWTFIRKALEQFDEGRVLIYCGTRKTTEEVCAQLKKHFDKVGFYHAGLSSEDRQNFQNQYHEQKIRILVATNAFGMGIDHPNVRLVIHYNMPSSIDSLYQEMGRAGRDNQSSTCLTLFSTQDKGLQSFFIKNSDAPANIKSNRWNALNSLVDYIESSECRHNEILQYYQDSQKFQKCGHCDNCDPGSERKVRKPMTPIKTILKPKSKSKAKEDAFVLNDQEQKLFEIFKSWRRKKALEQNTAAFVILSDRSLRQLAQEMPVQLSQFQEIYGMGEHKIDLYGNEIIEMVQDFDPN